VRQKVNTRINEVKKLLSRQLYGILATSGETHPHMNLVAFLASEDLKTVVFFSPENSEKIDNIKRSPGIALFADNRTNTREDITTVTSVTIYGNAALPGKSEKAAAWIERYIEKLPHMKDFASLETNILVKIDIDSIHVVRDLFEVTVIRTDEMGLQDD
jgi:nitroimidazol reductase NimA-like FMN-containing flavoprotein (pyridoxamine 5'-phosphate oxidase superfamily)